MTHMGVKVEVGQEVATMDLLHMDLRPMDLLHMGRRHTVAVQAKINML